MIVSNRLLVGCERRSSGASRHQLEARKRICCTPQLDASINDKVQFHVSASRNIPHRQRLWCCIPGVTTPRALEREASLVVRESLARNQVRPVSSTSQADWGNRWKFTLHVHRSPAHPNDGWRPTHSFCVRPRFISRQNWFRWSRLSWVSSLAQFHAIHLEDTGLCRLEGRLGSSTTPDSRSWFGRHHQ